MADAPLNFEIHHSLTLEFRRVLSEAEWREVIEAARQLPYVQGLQAEWTDLAELTRLRAERDQLLSFLNGASPSLLNTPKRNTAGESILSVQEHIRIAWGDIQQWLDELESLLARAEAAEAARDEARAYASPLTKAVCCRFGLPANANDHDMARWVEEELLYLTRNRTAEAERDNLVQEKAADHEQHVADIVKYDDMVEAAEAARDATQHRLDLFKHQLSVQEERTESWHHAYDALYARLAELIIVWRRTMVAEREAALEHSADSFELCANGLAIVLASAPSAAQVEGTGG